MKFIRRRLKNGITVLFEKREIPVAAVGIANPFGAAFENSKIKGIAHFIEHLVFTGTKSRTHEQISREIEKRGGVINAFTANEITCFWFKLPSEHVMAGLEILKDILENPTFNQEKFEKEKKVILEEIKMYHDSPQSYVHEKIVENMYGYPFGEGIIGSEKSIKALDREFVYNYFKQNYDPKNYIISIVGNVNINKICEYIEKSFNPNKNKKLLSEQKIMPLNKESIEKRSGIDQAHLLFGMHAPKPQDKDMYSLEVLDAFLANGLSSHLFLTIREEKGLAYTVSGSINAEKNYAYYTIYVGTTKEAVPEVKKLILEGFRHAEKMTESEFEGAKERLIGLRKILSEESAKVMNELLFAELADKAENYYSYEDKIRRVKLKDVQRIAKVRSFSTAAVVPA